MLKKLLRLVLAIVLCALLATQPVFAQAASDATTIPSRPTIELPLSSVSRGVEVHFILLDSVSSATAAAGQTVHFAVAVDVMDKGLILIPRGTPATGVVSRVTKGIPGKRNGYVAVEPREIRLTNQAGAKSSVKLMRNAPGEDDCGDMGPCAALVTFFVLLSPLIAALIVVESPFLVFYAIKESHHHKLTPPAVTGEDEQLQPCAVESAYIRSKMAVIHPQSATIPVDPLILAGLDQCQAGQKHPATHSPAME